MSHVHPSFLGKKLSHRDESSQRTTFTFNCRFKSCTKGDLVPTFTLSSYRKSRLSELLSFCSMGHFYPHCLSNLSHWFNKSDFSGFLSIIQSPLYGEEAFAQVSRGVVPYNTHLVAFCFHWIDRAWEIWSYTHGLLFLCKSCVACCNSFESCSVAIFRTALTSGGWCWGRRQLLLHKELNSLFEPNVTDYARECGFRLPKVTKIPSWVYNIHGHGGKSPKSMDFF